MINVDRPGQVDLPCASIQGAMRWALPAHSRRAGMQWVLAQLRPNRWFRALPAWTFQDRRAEFRLTVFTHADVVSAVRAASAGPNLAPACPQNVANVPTFWGTKNSRSRPRARSNARQLQDVASVRAADLQTPRRSRIILVENRHFRPGVGLDLWRNGRRVWCRSWRRMGRYDSGRMKMAERQQLKSALLVYCCQDTSAIIKS